MSVDVVSERENGRRRMRDALLAEHAPGSTDRLLRDRFWSPEPSTSARVVALPQRRRIAETDPSARP